VTMPSLTLVSIDDWQGFYVDGKLVFEGHSVPLRDAFLAAGLELEDRGLDGTNFERALQTYGHPLPQHLSDVPTRDEAEGA
jgi:hypothetical protein